MLCRRETKEKHPKLCGRDSKPPTGVYVNRPLLAVLITCIIEFPAAGIFGRDSKVVWKPILVVSMFCFFFLYERQVVQRLEKLATIIESSLACVESRAAAAPVQRKHQRVYVRERRVGKKQKEKRDRLNMSCCCCCSWLMLFFSLSGGREDVAC